MLGFKETFIPGKGLKKDDPGLLEIAGQKNIYTHTHTT